MMPSHHLLISSVLRREKRSRDPSAILQRAAKCSGVFSRRNSNGPNRIIPRKMTISSNIQSMGQRCCFSIFSSSSLCRLSLMEQRKGGIGPRVAGSSGTNRVHSSSSVNKTHHNTSAADRRRLRSTVEGRLKAQFPLEFESRVDGDGRDDERALLSSVRTLLALNGGFEPVATPSGTSANSRLYLAEGVVATPPSYGWKSVAAAAAGYRMMAKTSSATRDRLFARPMPPSSSPASRSPFPDFVEEDITLYRMVENSAARFLDRRSSAVREWGRKRFVLPLQNARYRTRVALKSMNEAQKKFHGFIGNSPKSIDAAQKSIREEDTGKKESSMPNSSAIVSDSITEVHETNNNNTHRKGGHHAVKNNDDEPLETLLVVSSRPKRQSNKSSSLLTANADRDNADDEEVVVSMTLYRNMTPSTRILALPEYYVLRHSSASTLVSVSLVAFGALPMAYRSVAFSLDYGWLVGGPAVASSVVATVVYYIWISRVRARVSQGRTIADARGARVYARDDAALGCLREGACRAVAGAVAREARGVCGGTAVDYPKELGVDFGTAPKYKVTEGGIK